MRLDPPRLRIEPDAAARLELQARALAREAAAAAAEGERSVVVFSLRGERFALDTRAVERAVARLGATARVPLAGGGDRLVAWVEEQPLVVTDLAALAGFPPRAAAALAIAPGLVLETPAGPVALAVEGPLSLAEDRVAIPAGRALGDAGLTLAGRLAGGATLLDAASLVARVASRGSP